MKSRLLFLVACLLLLVSLAEAKFSYKRIGLGGTVGFSIANVVDYPDHHDFRTGYIFGATAGYPLNRMLMIQADFIFVGKGFDGPDTTYTLTDTVGSRTDDASWTALVGYFEIPLTAKFTLISQGKYRPYVRGGGFWAIPITNKQRLTSLTLTFDTDLEKVRNYDWGVTAGAGIDIKAGRGWLNFDVRYDISTQSLIKNEDYKSRAWLFRLGYWVDLGLL